MRAPLSPPSIQRMLRLLSPFALIGVIFVVTAATSAPAIDSGVKDEVVIAPVCPVQKAVVCPDYLGYGVHVKVTAGGKTVYSDDHGAFKIRLQPGSYTVKAYNNGGYHSTVQKKVRVGAHQFTVVRLNLDSGIR